MVCSFGDASVNHSTAAGAINTALNAAYRGLPVPILFVCEDNGWGISVPTPPGWIEAAYGSRPGLDYVAVDGADPLAARPVITQAVDRVREHRRPVFLHLKTVRFLGHAGSDAEVGLPADPGHRGRLRPRSRCWPRPACCVAAGARAGRAPGPLRGRPGRDRRRGRAAAGGDRGSGRRRGDGPAGPAPARPVAEPAASLPRPAAASSRGPWPSRSTPPWTRS